MRPEIYIFVLIIVLAGFEIYRGTYKHLSKNEWLINLLSFTQENLLRPLFAFFIAFILDALIPEKAGTLAYLPFWPTLIVFFFLQDFIHYWYHRLAHQWPLLWNIHRTHHSSPSMNILVTSRLNFLWQLLMPVNYVSGLAIYLGLTEVFIVWWSFRALLNYLTHTDIRWDIPLYKIRFLQPFIWVTEHIFTTPDAHHAHHGYGQYGKPMGNYAPVLIFWDFVFGTAKLPHHIQDKIGIENDPVYPWYQQLWWPLFKLKKAKKHYNVERTE